MQPVFPRMTRITQNKARHPIPLHLLVLAERLLVGGLSLLAALSGQSARSLVELNDALVAVLLTADLLRDSRRLV